jgi:hypothetical protein
MKASIQFTSPMSPAGPSAPPSPSKGPQPQKKSPMEEQNELKRKRLQNQQLQIQKQLKKLPKQPQQKAPMAGFLRAIASKMVGAAGPNDDPMALFAQVRPLIAKLSMVTMIVPDKTELMLGKTQGKNSNYCLLLRRPSEIDSTIIDRIKRYEKSFDRIVWDSAGIKMYVWWPYIPPAQPGEPPPATPAGPA